ncbi:CLUMA_CG002062, isoform A [Clunio marinus]|uniref:CLUMA_CG002062, isoform A n=1 Tax=Clunio marinus TaxID=568069 RepID=A0A1J1HK36_9DIPT|nr:CLUMA_CG002062, isoform A [Clunio marinus]
MLKTYENFHPFLKTLRCFRYAPVCHKKSLNTYQLRNKVLKGFCGDSIYLHKDLVGGDIKDLEINFDF